MNYAMHTHLALKLPPWRSRLVLAMLLLAFAGLVGRAVFLQVIDREFLQEQGEARYRRMLTLSANRGIITDRHGAPLAVSSPVAAVWASPTALEPISNDQYATLARLLDMPLATIKSRLEDRSREFVYLKRQLDPVKAEQIQALGIKGLSTRPEYKRFYPEGESMAHVVGFTDVDDRGQEGVELAYETWLAGKVGSWEVIRDSRGHVVEDVTSIVRPQDGKTLTLSIDRKIQYQAFRELKAAVEANKAKGGGIVVLDAQTGEILALANFPTYNPNARGKVQPEQRRNRALTDSFEPGSTMKPFTAAFALEAGTVHPHSVINAQGGTMVIGDRTIRDSHGYGGLTVEQIIQKSSNIGSAKMALGLDKDYFWSMLNRVGFGEYPRSGFPGEVRGQLRNPKTWVPVEQATMAYGHGIAVSLLQLARAYTIFANDGELKPVTFIKQDGPAVGTRVISRETSMALRKMLEMVTQPGGTAIRAQVLGYRVGGKTGTAHKVEGKGYAKNRYVASFVGIAPMSDPRIVVAVMIDEPSAGKHYGGQVAAPVFSSVVSGTLRLLGVAPDAPTGTEVVPASDLLDVKEET